MNHRFKNKSKNQTQAILALIEKGLSDYEKENPPDSDESEPEGTEKWFIDLLVRQGYLAKGQQIDNRTTAFLTHWLGMLDAWFAKE